MAGIRIGQHAFSGDFVRKDSVDKRVLSQLSGVPFLQNYAIFEENGTFVVPSGVERVLVLVIGGGGGAKGGGYSSVIGVETLRMGAGGVGGCVLSGIVNLRGVFSVNVVVGKATTGQKNTSNTDIVMVNSNSSSFGNFITAIGFTGNSTGEQYSITTLVTPIIIAEADWEWSMSGKGAGGKCNYSSFFVDGIPRNVPTGQTYGGNGGYNVGNFGLSGCGNGTGKDPFKLYQLALGTLYGGTGRGGSPENPTPSPGYGGGGAPGYIYYVNSYGYSNLYAGSGGGKNNGHAIDLNSHTSVGGDGADGVVCVFW